MQTDYPVKLDQNLTSIFQVIGSTNYMYMYVSESQVKVKCLATSRFTV